MGSVVIRWTVRSVGAGTKKIQAWLAEVLADTCECYWEKLEYGAAMARQQTQMLPAMRRTTLYGRDHWAVQLSRQEWHCSFMFPPEPGIVVLHLTVDCLNMGSAALAPKLPRYIPVLDPFMSRDIYDIGKLVSSTPELQRPDDSQRSFVRRKEWPGILL